MVVVCAVGGGGGGGGCAASAPIRSDGRAFAAVDRSGHAPLVLRQRMSSPRRARGQAPRVRARPPAEHCYSAHPWRRWRRQLRAKGASKGCTEAGLGGQVGALASRAAWLAGWLAASLLAGGGEPAFAQQASRVARRAARVAQHVRFCPRGGARRPCRRPWLTGGSVNSSEWAVWAGWIDGSADWMDEIRGRRSSPSQVTAPAACASGVRAFPAWGPAGDTGPGTQDTGPGTRDMGRWRSGRRFSQPGRPQWKAKRVGSAGRARRSRPAPGA